MEWKDRAQLILEKIRRYRNDEDGWKISKKSVRCSDTTTTSSSTTTTTTDTTTTTTAINNNNNSYQFGAMRRSFLLREMSLACNCTD